MAAIALRSITKHWGDAVALHGIDLNIASGTFCVLLGPSGCGKSTTLRILAGLDAPSGGTVSLDGQDVTALAPAARGVAMVFQNYALFPHLTVAGNIGFGLEVRRVPAHERQRRVQDAVELLGLQPLLARKPAQLSGGQQQRVALARALVAQARVCLMDEPLSNLDAQLRQDMRRELRELQQRLGLTVVYVTHDQAEAMSMADQVVLMQHGRIAQTDTPRQLYQRPANVFAARFIGTPAMSLLRLNDGCIAGSDVRAGAPHAAQLGLRPEDVVLGGQVSALVQGIEYLGADCVVRCAVGSESLTVRADGRQRLAVGETVPVGWLASAEHSFDAQGIRLP